jgi:hypothetical protein
MKNFLRTLAVALLAFAALTYSGAGSAQTAGEQPCVDTTALVSGVYRQILERVPDPDTMSTFEAEFAHGMKSVREVVREVALSAEFRSKYLEGRAEAEAVRLLYQRVLARVASPQELQAQAGAARAQGFAAVIGNLIDGEEYAREFGERGVPGRPVALRACRFPVTLKRDDTLGTGQKMTTELTFNVSGQLDATTSMEDQGAGGGFCGRIGVWLFDERDNVVGVFGPPRGERWCVKGQSPGPAQKTFEWHAQLTPDILQKVSAVALLQTSAAGSDPLDPTRENTERAKQYKRSLR